MVISTPSLKNFVGFTVPPDSACFATRPQWFGISASLVCLRIIFHCMVFTTSVQALLPMWLLIYNFVHTDVAFRFKAVRCLVVAFYQHSVLFCCSSIAYLLVSIVNTVSCLPGWVWPQLDQSELISSH
jgi:hypothetical protein